MKVLFMLQLTRTRDSSTAKTDSFALKSHKKQFLRFQVSYGQFMLDMLCC